MQARRSGLLVDFPGTAEKVRLIDLVPPIGGLDIFDGDQDRVGVGIHISR